MGFELFNSLIFKILLCFRLCWLYARTLKVTNLNLKYECVLFHFPLKNDILYFLEKVRNRSAKNDLLPVSALRSPNPWSSRTRAGDLVWLRLASFLVPLFQSLKIKYDLICGTWDCYVYAFRIWSFSTENNFQNWTTWVQVDMSSLFNLGTHGKKKKWFWWCLSQNLQICAVYLLRQKFLIYNYTILLQENSMIRKIIIFWKFSNL